MASAPLSGIGQQSAPSHTNEVCEAALAHVIENKTEAAYRRGDLFEKRAN